MATEDVDYKVSFGPDYWVAQLRFMLYSRLAMHRIFLSTLDDDSYLDRFAPRPKEGVMALTIANIASSEQLAKWTRRETVLSISRAVIEFIDTMIAIKSMKYFELTKATESENDIWQQLLECIELETRKVNTNKSLTIEKKRNFFPYLDPGIVDAFNAMFDIRHGLEHHRAIAKSDIQLSSKSVDIVANDFVTIQQLGHTVEAGDALYLKAQDKGRLILEGEEIDLSEEEITRMIFHVTMFLVPQLLRENWNPIQPNIEVRVITLDGGGKMVHLNSDGSLRDPHS